MSYAGLRAISYLRVSTKDQAMRGSYEIQLKNIEVQAENHGVILEKHYIDKGKHGWDLSTTEFKNMLEHLKKVDMLYIEHNDRLARGDPEDPTSMIDSLNLFRQIFRSGKIIFSIQEGELKMDSTIDTLLMSVKTYESSNRIVVDKKKQKDGIKRFREKHKRWGPKQKKLNVKQYLELRQKNHSKTTCAKFLGMTPATLNKRLHELNIDDFEPFKTKKN